MYKNKTFLAIIPARGGSKRLPKKNILPLNGKPLIAYTVEAAKNSKYLDEVLVNSDDEEILKIAKKLNIKTYKRDKMLAQDTTCTIEVILKLLENDNYKHYDYIVLLQPTSPLRNEKHIDEAIELLDKKNAEAIISVCQTEHSPLWANTLKDNDSMEGFLKEDIINKRSQDLPKFYRLNGAIYICKTDKLLEEKTFFIKKNIYAYKMDMEHSVDIDNKLDFKFAEFLLERN